MVKSGVSGNMSLHDYFWRSQIVDPKMMPNKDGPMDKVVGNLNIFNLG
jgi:hypothetical protein